MFLDPSFFFLFLFFCQFVVLPKHPLKSLYVRLLTGFTSSIPYFHLEQERSLTNDFSNFFKCRQTGMSGNLMEHLLEIYQNKGDFCLWKWWFRFRLRDMALISGLNATSLALRKTSAQDTSFKSRFFGVITNELPWDNQAVLTKYVSRVNPGDERVSMLNIDSKEWFICFLQNALPKLLS